MSPEQHDAEGNSPAAWTAVIIMLVAFIVGTIAFWFDLPWVVVIAAVVLALGPVVGFFLARAGYGIDGPKHSPETRN